MPLTRKRARMMESQDEDVEEEPAQSGQETQDELEQQASSPMEAPEVVNLKEMAKQLTDTLKHLMTTHRQLEDDAVMIQTGMDELYRMQESRAQRIVGRLKNASSTILTFGDTSQEVNEAERPENEDEEVEDGVMG